MRTVSPIGTCSVSVVSHQMWSAAPGAASADANWSMIPQATPTYSTSTRWASRAASRSGSSAPARRARATVAATSSAADELSPAPAGTSLATAISTGGRAMPRAASATVTPLR